MPERCGGQRATYTVTGPHGGATPTRAGGSGARGCPGDSSPPREPRCLPREKATRVPGHRDARGHPRSCSAPKGSTAHTHHRRSHPSLTGGQEEQQRQRRGSVQRLHGGGRCPAAPLLHGERGRPAARRALPLAAAAPACRPAPRCIPPPGAASSRRSEGGGRFRGGRGGGAQPVLGPSVRARRSAAAPGCRARPHAPHHTTSAGGAAACAGGGDRPPRGEGGSAAATGEPSDEDLVLSVERDSTPS